ncbi:uncharacterized protein DSM5745_11023 [Aspergillus mulundensis]|uniref:Uncharacterized protein n=1 Tax=Aspergillus mulundensis TaxID=1810919 RepID=A0A3D8QCJ9_9EURO|nr:hypothetical protein DSM5745_11023 [Aspergillus mulundensis]RDW59328.1 hypothetical protein DSM5745_11023 [Aspergillus mulundensis]
MPEYTTLPTLRGCLNALLSWLPHKESPRQHEIIEAEEEFLSFCGIASRAGRKSKIWRIDSTDNTSEIPTYLLTLIEDYSIAMRPTGTVATTADIPIPSRPRVDAILNHVLATVKRRVLAGLTSQEQSEACGRLQRIFWSYEQVVHLADTAQRQGNILDCAVDYVLWHGDQPGLETNLIVVRAVRPVGTNGDEQCRPVLAAMSLIQHNRTKHSANKETYGVLTDGYEWIFLHIDKKYKLSSLKLSWNEDHQAVVNQFSKIIYKAFKLKLSCPEEELPDLIWNKEAREMATIWNSPKWKKDYRDGESSDEEHEQEYPDFKSLQNKWFADLEMQFRQFRSSEHGVNTPDTSRRYHAQNHSEKPSSTFND